MSEENKKKNGAETSSSESKEVKKAEEKVDEKEENKAVDKAEEKKEAKEELKDSEIVDINKLEEEKNVKTSSLNPNEKGTKAQKKNSKVDKGSVEYLLAKKRKKKIRNWIIFGVIVVLIIWAIFSIKKKTEQAKLMFEAMSSSNVETATVESKTLSKSVTATGQLLSADARTITRNLNGVADIIEVNVAVGDYVQQGDVLVRFSTENVDKSISETKEDISTQRQQDAIDSRDAERNYINSYKGAATNLQKAAKTVDKALENLHEACDAYGDAKRELQKAKDEGADEKTLASYEARVSTAYEAQKKAQEAYDDAVEAEAQAIDTAQSQSLSSADSQYAKSQLNANSSVKQLQRKLKNYEDSLDDYIVTAPISGVVTAVNVSEGNSFSSGSVLTIQDLSRFEAEVLVDEYDIPSVKSAFVKANDRGEELEVIIKTEATEKNEYKGHVVSIDPTSTSTATYTTSASATSNGSNTAASSSSTPQYKVKIMIDEPDEAFMMGMTAKVSIIVEQSPENSLSIPYNALEENSDGEFIVKVVDNADKFDKKKNDDSIVVEKDNDDNEGSGRSKGGMKRNDFASSMQGMADKLKDANSEEEMQKIIEESKPKTHDVKVKKIFDTDYYTAVVPIVPGELKEGDVVLIDTDKYSGSNDMMQMMMGGPGPM